VDELRDRWAALRQRIGRRGDCLLFFGSLDLVYAWGMFTATAEAKGRNGTFLWVEEIIPLDVWAAVWMTVGVICVVEAFQRFDRVGFIAAIGIKVVWGAILFGGWAADVFGWIDYSTVTVGSVGIWLGLAGLVWRISGWAEPEVPDSGDAGEDDSHDRAS
jgi:hypothetical protein